MFQTSITSNSPPECPRSIKRQAPKPPPPPSSAKCTELVFHSANSSFSDDEYRPNDVIVTNQKLLAEYCEQIEKEQSHNSTSRDINKEPPPPPPPSTITTTMTVQKLPVVDACEVIKSRESSTFPLVSSLQSDKRPTYEKKKYGKAGKVGLKIKKFLRIPSRESMPTNPSSQPTPRPKLEIIHPLDINKSGVEIIHYPVEGLYPKELVPKIPTNNHYTGWYIFTLPI